jgi:hypothetical protein
MLHWMTTQKMLRMLRETTTAAAEAAAVAQSRALAPGPWLKVTEAADRAALTLLLESCTR